jgi:hypothetical protein
MLFLILLLIMSGLAIGQTERPWQKISDPTVAQMAADFNSPPPEYSMTFYWGWDGPITEEVITRDLNAFKARGVQAVTLEPGYDMEYLTPHWFEMVKAAVEQARKQGMRVWLVDEGKYPSGFAGGKFTKERPDLRMQALVAERVDVTSGETLSRDLLSETVGAFAINQVDNATRVLDTSSGKISWTAPEGKWQVLLVRHEFRTSPTRAVNNPTRGKDTSNSLCDYLDAAATRQFIEFTHEQYKKYFGDQFGKTVLGFRGDEPDYSISGIPWTPKIFAEFEKRKGYDVRPYLASFFAKSGLTEEQQRAKADYWDVWSDLFSENFFKVQADWCASNNLEYLVHLNHEDQMPALVRSEGDFFKCMRHVQMPGIDTIWSQIWLDKVADFPKYASSAAHLFGRPRAFTESFAAYKPAPNVEQAKWILNHQLVRGINMVEVMFVPASNKGVLGLRGWLTDEQFPTVAKYIHRACFLLSQGRPTAQIALYHPTMSLWLGDNDADASVLKIAQQLLEQQRDFDFVDDRTLGSTLKLDGDRLINLSLQGYRAVIIPSTSAISKAALDRLQAFSKAGGKVFFVGREPSMIVEKTFLKATGPADISGSTVLSSSPSKDWAVKEPAAEMTVPILAALPEPDVTLETSNPSIKYLHRRLRDGDLYFFFNESNEKKACKAALAGIGQSQVWDAASGRIEPLVGITSKAGFTSLLLELEPYQTKFIVIGP